MRAEASSATEVNHLSFETPARLTVAKVRLEGGAGDRVPLVVQASRDGLLRVLAPGDHAFSAEATGGHDEEPNWTGTWMTWPLAQVPEPKARVQTVSTVPLATRASAVASPKATVAVPVGGDGNCCQPVEP